MCLIKWWNSLPSLLVSDTGGRPFHTQSWYMIPWLCYRWTCSPVKWSKGDVFFKHSTRFQVFWSSCPNSSVAGIRMQWVYTCKNQWSLWPTEQKQLQKKLNSTLKRLQLQSQSESFLDTFSTLTIDDQVKSLQGLKCTFLYCTFRNLTFLWWTNFNPGSKIYWMTLNPGPQPQSALYQVSFVLFIKCWNNSRPHEAPNALHRLAKAEVWHHVMMSRGHHKWTLKWHWKNFDSGSLVVELTSFGCFCSVGR